MNGNTILNYAYSFNDTSGHDNGNVMGITDNVTPGLSWTYSYDAVNRLTSAQTQATSGADCFGQTYGYDAWGNLLQENVTKCTGYMLNASANTNNQLTNGGQTYDPSGQMTSDGTHSYTFDAEDDLTAVDGGGTAKYTYDAEGNRARKDAGSSWTQYVFFGGAVIAENTPSGWTDYVFANGQRLARATGSSSSGTVYYHADHLGTTRIETDASGNVLAECTYAPFGQVISCSPDDAANNYRFTGQERDAETNVDNFLARNYTSQFGRFLQPDPAGTAAADPMNPESWNRYAYVTNNPTNFIDPSGMCGEPDGQGTHGSVEVIGHPPCSPYTSFVVQLLAIALSPSQPISPFGMGWMPCGYDGSSCKPHGGGNWHGPTMPQKPQQPQKPQAQTQAVCPTGSPNNHLSMGDQVDAATVNPFTSGNGGIWGGNRQSFPATTNNYTYSGKGLGLDVGASIQSAWAWGSGSWSGSFHSVNWSIGVFSGSIFWTPGKGGWTGVSFGLGLGLPGVAYEQTNYTCKSGPG